MKTVFFHDHIITQSGNKYYSSGGLNEVIISRYRQLCDEFCLGTRSNPARSINNLSYVGSAEEIGFVPIPNLASFRPSNYKKAYNLISEAVNNNDFIIVRLPSIIGFIATYIAKKRRVPYLIELVGCPWDSYSNYSAVKGRLIALPFFIITRFLIKNSDCVLYVTKFFLQKRYPTNTINTIGCSDVELIIDSRIYKERMIRIASEKDTITIGMIGSLEAKYKGFDTVIKALHHLKKQSKTNYRLKIVGGGNSAKIKKYCQEFGVQDMVEFKGTLPHPVGIFNWLDTVDIFLQPSRVEGLPRALVEAMSRGCACIGSDVGGIPELLDSSAIHPKNDFKKLATLIHKYSDREMMKNQSVNCFSKAKEYDKLKLDPMRTAFYKSCFSNFDSLI